MEHEGPIFGWSQGELEEGLRQYEAGEFFAAHEAWESVWLQSREPEKTFLQALIQVAAAFHHLHRNNPLGTQRLLHAARQRLERYPKEFGGISVHILLKDVEQWLRILKEEEPLHSRPAARIEKAGTQACS